MGRKILRWKDSAIVYDDRDPLLIKIQTLRSWSSLEKLYEAFRNPRTGTYEPRTWPQLVSSGVPKSTLSRALRKLIQEGNIEAQAKVDLSIGKRETIYVPVKPWHPTMSYRAAKASLKTPDGRKIDLGIVMGRWTRKTPRRKSWFKFAWGEKALLQERIQKLA